LKQSYEFVQQESSLSLFIFFHFDQSDG